MNTITILSGADVSGSCYLAEINGLRVLFDCGVKPNCNYSDHFDIPFPETVDAVFISHAHIDHMGAIAYAASVCSNAKIYATAMTADFLMYQLSSTVAGYIGANTESLRYHNALLCRLVMNRIEIIGFDSKNERASLSGLTYKFAFFRAGHMPGAAMIYLQVEKYKILYTGDFSARETSLTGRYELPHVLPPVDTLLLCGLHANEPDFELRTADINDSYERKIKQAFAKCSKIVIPSAQLTKGLEMISVIVGMIDKGSMDRCDVYLGDTLWQLAKSYENKAEEFRLPCYIKKLSERASDTDEYDNEIIISDNHEVRKMFSRFEEIRPDFSLHADYSDLVYFINKIKPNEVFVVHVNNKALRSCLPNEDRIVNNIGIYYPDNGDTCKLNGRR